MTSEETAQALAEKLFAAKAHGALRAAFVELVAPALEQTRRDALREAARAVAAEGLVENLDDPTDIAYNSAVWDCEKAVLELYKAARADK